MKWKFILFLALTITLSPSLFGQYSVSPSSTTSGGGTWGSILKMDCSVSGSNAYFTVSKQSGSFTSSGTMYLDIYINGNWASTGISSNVNVNQSSVSLSYYLGNISSSQFPVYFGAYYVSNVGGDAYVGSIGIYKANQPPTTPSISAPSNGVVGQNVTVTFYTGADSDGDNVKVHGTSPGSNYPGPNTSNTFVSNWYSSSGGSESRSFNWSSAGTKTIYATTFDTYGNASGTRTRTIVVNNPAPPPPTAYLASPNNGTFTVGQSVYVDWTSTNQHHYSLELYKGSTKLGIISNPNPSSVTSHTWTIPSSLGGYALNGGSYRYKIVVWNSNDASIAPASDYGGYFTINPAPPTAYLASPNSGTFTVGQSVYVDWTSTNQHHYSLELYKGSTKLGIISNPNPSSVTSHTWTIPSSLGGYALNGGSYRYKIVVWNSNDASIAPASDYGGYFTINPAPPTAYLASPNSGIFTVGQSVYVDWTSTNQHHYSLELYKGSTKLGIISNPNPSSVTSHTWTIPSSLGGYALNGGSYRYKIVIWNSNDASIAPASDYGGYFTINPAPPTVTLTYPNNGIFQVGDNINVTWNSTNQHHYSLELYKGGTQIAIMSNPNPSTSESTNWAIPATLGGTTLNGSTYRFKIVVWNSNDASQPNAYDYGTYFTINPAPPPAPTVILTYPNNGTFQVGDNINVTWNSMNQHHYSLELYKGGTQIAIISNPNPSTSESTNWIIPATLGGTTLNGSTYRFKIVVWNSNDASQPNAYDYGTYFTINPAPPPPPTVTLTYPNNGIFQVGDNINVTWNSTNQHHYSLELYQGGTQVAIISNPNPSTSESTEWAIPAILDGYTLNGSTYRFKIVVWNSNDVNQPNAYDYGTYFTITPAPLPPPTVTLSYPNAGTFQVGDNINVTWNSTDQHHYSLELYKGGTQLAIISNPDPSAAIYKQWTIPSVLNGNALDGNDYRFKIVIWNTNGTSAFDYSENFSINPIVANTPVVNLINPNSGSLQVGQTISFNWSSENQHHYSLELYKGGINALNQVAIIDNPSISNSENYLWTIPSSINGHAINGNDYRFKIVIWNSDDANSSMMDYDFNNGIFSITPTNSASTYSISGTITDENGNGVEGVIVSFYSYSSLPSNAGGTYSINGIFEGTSGNLSPSLQNFDFSPSNKTITNVTSNIIDQDFIASPQNIPFAINDFGIGIVNESISIFSKEAGNDVNHKSSSIDLEFNPIEDMKEIHHTSEYEDLLVFRRAFPIYIYIKHSGDLEEIEIKLRKVDGPSQQDITVSTSSNWRIESVGDRLLMKHFKIFIKKDLPIGKYKLVVNGEEDDKEFYVIFNPYGGREYDDIYYYDEEVCHGPDFQYKLNDKQLKEYVEGEKIYKYVNRVKEEKLYNPLFRGVFRSDHHKKEVFEYIMNEIANSNFDLDLNKSSKLVAGFISSISHKNENPDGILFGEWDSPETCPDNESNCNEENVYNLNWKYASDMIEQKVNNEGAYNGQCFNFAQLSTSLLRAVGIPARIVGNAGSAMDFDSDGKVNMYLDESQWNYHEWTEVWIPYTYKGIKAAWCAIDGTYIPDNRIGNLHAAGPARILAIPDYEDNILNSSENQDGFWDEKYFYVMVNAEIYSLNGIKLNNLKEIEIDGEYYSIEEGEFASYDMKTHDKSLGGDVNRLFAYLDKNKKEALLLGDGIVNRSISEPENIVEFSKEYYSFGEELELKIQINNDYLENTKYYYTLSVKDITNLNGGSENDTSNNLLVVSDSIMLSPDSIYMASFNIPQNIYQRSDVISANMIITNELDSLYAVLENDNCSIAKLEITSNDSISVLSGELGTYNYSINNIQDSPINNLEVRISSSDELSFIDTTIFVINSLAVGELLNQSIEFVGMKDGTLPIHIDVFNFDIGEVHYESLIMVKDTAKLVTHIECAPFTEINEVFPLDINIKNIHGQKASNVIYELILPSNFFESMPNGSIDTIDIEGYQSYIDTLLLTPIKYGDAIIQLNVYHNGDTLTAGTIVSVDEFIQPNAPINLDTLEITNSNIDLIWEDQSDNEDGFFIERSDGDANGFEQIGFVTENINIFSDTTVNVGIDYFYRVQSFNNGGESAYSNIVHIKIKEYCSTSASSNFEWIESISIGNFNNETGNDDGYGNYTDQIITLHKGDQHHTILEPGFSTNSYLENWKIWIDTNHDFVYDNSEIIYQATSDSIIHDYFVLPANTPTGSTNMRIGMKWDGQETDLQSCDTDIYGEVEDYRVEVVSYQNNDICSDAGFFQLSPSGTVGPFDNIGATTSNDGDINTGCFYNDDPYSATIYLSFEGDGNEYILNTTIGCNSLQNPLTDPQISLRKVTCDGIEIACDDDSAGSLQSQITFVTEPGVMYYLLVDGFGDNEGEFCLELERQAKAYDSCSDAWSLELSPNITYGPFDNMNATTSNDGDVNPECFYNDDPYSSTVYFSFEGDGNEYILNTTIACNSIETPLTDPQLSLRKYACDSTEIACDDDSAGSLQSQISFATESGVMYYLLVDGFSTSEGEFCLELERQAKIYDSCSDAVNLELSPTSTYFGSLDNAIYGPFDNINASTSNDGNVNPGCFYNDDSYSSTVYFSFEGDGNEYIINTTITCNSIETPLTDPQLSLRKDACNGLEVACDDDSAGFLQSQITFNTVLGVMYYLLVDGFGTNEGEFCLELERQVKVYDNCSDAWNLELTTGTYGPFDNIYATTVNDGDINPGCFISDDPYSSTVYFSFEGDGNEYLLNTTINCNEIQLPLYDPQLSLRKYACDSIEIACDDDSGDQYQSQISFVTEDGVMYYLLVDGFSTSEGEFCLEIERLDSIQNMARVTDNISFKQDDKSIISNSQTNVSVYPNPASTEINFEINLESATVGILSIYNQIGQLVKTYELDESLINHNLQLSVRDFPDGVYHYELVALEEIISGKFLIVK